MTEKKILSEMADDQSPFSNPFSVGVLGLAIACFALAPVLTGQVPKNEAIGFAPWAILFGGAAQVIGGIIDLRNKSILGGTALTMYGLLWIALGLETLWGKSGVIGGQVDIMLLLMSLGFTYAFASTNLITFLLLVHIDFAFIGLALTKLKVVNLSFALGILVYSLGIFSVYAATAFLLNTHFGKEKLPMGKALINK